MASRKTKRRVSLLVAAGIAATGVLALQMGGAGATDGAAATTQAANVLASSGSTYVEGARPSANADARTGEGCVKYSPDRPDVEICSSQPLPEGWTPDPAPYFDQAICEAAAQDVNDPSQLSKVSASHFPEPPTGNGSVDLSSCRIVQNAHDAFLDVVFVRDAGANNVHVAYRP